MTTAQPYVMVVEDEPKLAIALLHNAVERLSAQLLS